MQLFASELPFHIHGWLIISLKDVCTVIRKCPTFFAVYLTTSLSKMKFNIEYSCHKSMIKLPTLNTVTVCGCRLHTFEVSG